MWTWPLLIRLLFFNREREARRVLEKNPSAIDAQIDARTRTSCCQLRHEDLQRTHALRRVRDLQPLSRLAVVDPCCATLDAQSRVFQMLLQLTARQHANV